MIRMYGFWRSSAAFRVRMALTLNPRRQPGAPA